MYVSKYYFILSEVSRCINLIDDIAYLCIACLNFSTYTSGFSLCKFSISHMECNGMELGRIRTRSTYHDENWEKIATFTLVHDWVGLQVHLPFCTCDVLKGLFNISNNPFGLRSHGNKVFLHEAYDKTSSDD